MTPKRSEDAGPGESGSAVGLQCGREGGRLESLPALPEAGAGGAGERRAHRAVPSAGERGAAPREHRQPGLEGLHQLHRQRGAGRVRQLHPPLSELPHEQHGAGGEWHTRDACTRPCVCPRHHGARAGLPGAPPGGGFRRERRRPHSEETGRQKSARGRGRLVPILKARVLQPRPSSVPGARDTQPPSVCHSANGLGAGRPAPLPGGGGEVGGCRAAASC